MKLSLLVTYRDRPQHLNTQIAWWNSLNQDRMDWELLLIEVTENPSDWIQDQIRDTSIRYGHCPCPGVFHKTRALNLGLQLAYGQFVAPFDVDLIPLPGVLNRHLQAAEQAPGCLMTGYRVMHSAETVDVNQLSSVLEQTAIAPEDQPTALWKQLIRQERFGVVPFFHRRQLIQIGGWDEQFIGWGGEDQDVIERYLQGDRILCRCPELVYLHLFHQPDPQWAEATLTQKNREYYYRQRC